jgi:hypothetical protein
MYMRALAVFPLLWVVVFLVGDTLLQGDPSHLTFLRVEIELAKTLNLLGAWAAALSFDRGDYLRRAWFLIGACMALLLLRDLTIVPGVAEAMGASSVVVFRGVLVVAANASQVVGTWLLARAWQRASLALPGSQASQWGVRIAAIMLAVSFAGPGVVSGFDRFAAGDWAALAGAASALGDMISLCLIAPLLLTALALRGGLFGWPFWLLTTSYVAWLAYDAGLVLGPALGLSAVAVRTASEAFRGLGSTLGAAAGLAQREVVRSVRRLKV